MATVAEFDRYAVLTAFASSVIFLLGYSALAPWWRHPIGRAVASLDASLTVTLLPSALHQLFGLKFSSLFFAWYYGVSLYLVAAVTLWRLGVIWTVQRDTITVTLAPKAEQRPATPDD